MALDFADGAGQEITVLGGSFTPPSVGSVCFWAIPDDITRRRIMGFDDAWEAVLAPGGEWSNNFFAAGSGVLDSTTLAVVGQLDHLVMTWNFSTNALQIFLNGVLDASNSLADDDPGSGTLLLGHRMGAAFSEHFDGDLEDIRIYNRVLSASEVQTIFTARGVDGIVHGLLHRWTFNEKHPGATASGAGSIKDLVGARNGTPSASPVYSISNLRYRRKTA